MIELINGIGIGIISSVAGRLLYDAIRWKSIIFLNRRIKRVLKKYRKHRFNTEKEKKLVRRLGFLVDHGKMKLDLKGYKYLNSGDTINNGNFSLHFTRNCTTKMVNQFLVRRLNNGKIKKPDEAYSSENYPEHQKSIGDIRVLSDFIKVF